MWWKNNFITNYNNKKTNRGLKETQRTKLKRIVSEKIT